MGNIVDLKEIDEDPGFGLVDVNLRRKDRAVDLFPSQRTDKDSPQKGNDNPNPEQTSPDVHRCPHDAPDTLDAKWFTS